MNKNKILLLIIGIASLSSFVFGIINYFHNNFSEIAIPFWWLGIFIWGDALIIGLFLLISSIFLWYKNDPNITGLVFSLYISTRSFIEILYNLNAQFSTTIRPWEYFVSKLAISLSLQIFELYVLAQILWTIIFICSFLVFIVFFKRYLKN